MAKIYLDTSFFMAAIENQLGRRAEARKILEFEESEGSAVHTSILTINEFVGLYYDRHRKQSDCENLIDEVVTQIRQLAAVYGLTEKIGRRAALIQSVWGEVYGQKHPDLPRDRKFRWDALHVATADALQCVRVYAWDNPWLDIPKKYIPNIGAIISPAVCPSIFFVSKAEAETTSENLGLEEPAQPVANTASSQDQEGVGSSPASSTEPPPPSGQSPAAAPATASQPVPSLPSTPLDGQEPPPPPAEDLPAPPPDAEPPSLSVPTRSDEPAS
jgi:predicted nucleic acid-binding protein